MPPLPNPANLQKIIAAGWSYDSLAKSISKQYTFSKGFLPTWGFLNQLALYSHKVGHHPEIITKYNSVKLTLHTDDDSALTEKDISMAKKADNLFNQLK